MNMRQATGPGGVPFNPPAQSNGAALVGTIQNDADNAHTAHGLVMVVATLAVAPVDAVAASLLRKWPILHILTSVVYLVFIVTGMALGVITSKEYILVSLVYAAGWIPVAARLTGNFTQQTQNFNTGHQLFGFVIVALMALVGIFGTAHRLIVASARRRDQQPPEKSSLVRHIHMWSGRLIWVLLVINTGL